MKFDKDLIECSLVNIYWGLTTVLMKHALSYMSSSTYVGLRMLCGALFILIFARKAEGLNRKTIIHGMILGFLLVLNMEILVLGLNYTSATNSVFIAQLTLVFVPLAVSILYKKRPDKALLITILFVLLGLGILSEAYKGKLNFGDFLTFISMLCNSMSIILASSFAKSSSSGSLSFVRLIFAGLICFVFSLFGDFAIEITFRSILILILTGFIGTGLAYSVQLSTQKNLDPMIVSLIGILNPLFGMIGAAVIADVNGVTEPLNIHKIIGAFIIMAALFYYFKKSNEGQKQ